MHACIYACVCVSLNGTDTSCPSIFRFIRSSLRMSDLVF